MNIENINEDEARDIENPNVNISRQLVSASDEVFRRNDQNSSCHSPSFVKQNFVNVETFPLPDITKTEHHKNISYVCLLKFNKADTPKGEQKFPKVFYFDGGNNGNTSKVSTNSSDTKKARTPLCNGGCSRKTVENSTRPIPGGDSPTITDMNDQSRSSDTKETSLSKEHVATFHSENTKYSGNSKHVHERYYFFTSSYCQSNGITL